MKNKKDSNILNLIFRNLLFCQHYSFHVFQIPVFLRYLNTKVW